MLDDAQTWPNFDLIPFPPPQLSHMLGGAVRVKNTSPVTIIIPKNSHIGDLKQVTDKDLGEHSWQSNQIKFGPAMCRKPPASVPICEVNKIPLDPHNILEPHDRNLFDEINKR